MHYVDEINMAHGGEGTKLYSTAGSQFKKLCIQNKLNLLDASVRHLGTDINYVVLENLYDRAQGQGGFLLRHLRCRRVDANDGRLPWSCTDKAHYDVRQVHRLRRPQRQQVDGDRCAGSCDIPTKSNRVDIGVRGGAALRVVFSHLTDELYESKIVYRTEKFEDNVRTFCMNPKGAVVNENTNGIVTVNGHSYEDPAMHTREHQLRPAGRPSTSPSRSRTATATARASPGFPICWAAASSSSASAT